MSTAQEPEASGIERGDVFSDALKDRLLHDSAYAGKFVAVKGDEILDVDADEFALVKRISRKFPSEVVFITRATDEDEDLDVPSPECYA